MAQTTSPDILRTEREAIYIPNNQGPTPSDTIHLPATTASRATQTLPSTSNGAWSRFLNFSSPIKLQRSQNDDRNLPLQDLENHSGQSRVSLDSTSPSSSTANVSSNLTTSRAVNISCKGIRPCYILIILGILTIIISLAPAIWRSTTSKDLSGGFSLAQYILGVGVFVVGSATVIHSKTCTCWQ